VNQFSYAAYSCEMPESLFATFTSIDTFSQHLYSEVAAKFLAVLEAVSDCLCHAVDTNRNAINSLALALRFKLPLATSDSDLLRAVASTGVKIL
jgi:hypothetical protein